MSIKTLLNKICKLKSFVFTKIVLTENEEIEIYIKPRSNSRPKCSKCAKICSRRGVLPSRRYEFIPIWGLKVFFVYAPRRVKCKKCGVKVEQLPWSRGKEHMTVYYKCFLSFWSKHLSWQVVAIIFNTSWNSVYRAVEYVVDYGMKNRSLKGIQAIGVDEIYWSKKKKYITLVYQLDEECRRLLYVASGRTTASLLGFFRLIRKTGCQQIEFVCSDMWQPYIRIIERLCPNALHILDPFHIISSIQKAVDEVRATEAKSLMAKGVDILKNTRWLILKKPEDLKEEASVKLKELTKINMKTVRAYLLKEEFRQFWDYTYAACAEKFLNSWCNKVMRSKIEPLKKKIKKIRQHKYLILNWFIARKRYSSGIVEGFNNKAKLTIKKAYGFRTVKALKIALFHQLGELPEPEFTHRFW